MAPPFLNREAGRRAAAPRPGSAQAGRNPTPRWAAWGALCGALLALPAFAPAAWLADWLQGASGGRLLLADARGSVWSGSAVAVLGGGTGSQEARALPGRLQWTLRPAFVERGPALLLRLAQPCCLNGSPSLSLQPGWGTLRVSLAGEPPGTLTAVGGPTDREIGHWPAGWLTGLGTPWNTLQLGGVLSLATPGVALQWAQGRWRVEGSAALELQDASSRVATLARLGSYRLELGSDPTNPGAAALQLQTLNGALQLSGNGSLTPGGWRFRGEATAQEAQRPALTNLLNIIGRREGARSVIAIG
jgi:general secretion pathway protein N